MVKEKELTYVFDEEAKEYRFNIYDPQQVLVLDNIGNLIASYISSNNIPSIVTPDTYSYKIGFMKSNTLPCISIAHNMNPKDYKKLAIAIMRQENGNVAFNIGWFGVSEADRLYKKAEKKNKKRQKLKNQLNEEDDEGNSVYLKSHSVVGTMAKAKFTEMSLNRAVQKNNARAEVEAEYYKVILNMIQNVKQILAGAANGSIQ